MSAPAITAVKPRTASTAPRDATEPLSQSARILYRVFETLESAAIPYCVLHGYEDFSGSDVDCLIEDSITARDLLVLFHRNRDRIDAEVVRCLDHYFVFAGRNDDGTHNFVTLDFAYNVEANDLPLRDGREVLATRRRYKQFYIPAVDTEFSCYLARAIAKKTLGDDRAARLTRLFQQDSAGCAARVARDWNSISADMILSAARSSDWTLVRERLAELHAELRRCSIKRCPLGFVANKLRGFFGRARRLLWPDGVSVVLLGPDGAGKSSVIDIVGPNLAPVFPHWACWGFAPGLSLLRRGPRTTSDPHGLPPRSLAVSLLRLAYWFAYHTLGFVTLRLALARSTLVLYDRHFVDILVDQNRYRYGGPVWMLRALWRLIPKPDLIILLDAPPEVLQRRKREVPFEVTAHQREAYLALVRTLPNGRIVDANAPQERVANAVSKIIAEWAACRNSRRYIS